MSLFLDSGTRIKPNAEFGVRNAELKKEGLRFKNESFDIFIKQCIVFKNCAETRISSFTRGRMRVNLTR
jgi:hypothetical protein